MCSCEWLLELCEEACDRPPPLLRELCEELCERPPPLLDRASAEPEMAKASVANRTVLHICPAIIANALVIRTEGS